MTNQPLEEKWKETFVEAGANIEHDRWARWQKYLHFIFFNPMSTKKEKCCECTSKERPSHVFRSSGTPGMKDGGYFTCNCPCHQSEIIEWEEIARDTAEHIGIISQGCLETLCEEVAEKAYKEGLSENIEELERTSEKYKTLFSCIRETEREKVKAAFKETRDAFHEDDLHCGCLAMCEWILDGKPEANINPSKE